MESNIQKMQKETSLLRTIYPAYYSVPAEKSIKTCRPCVKIKKKVNKQVKLEIAIGNEHTA